MSDIMDKWQKERETEKLLDSLILESTKNGTLVWKRRWFGIYRYVAQVGAYTLKLLDSNSDSHTVYISTASTRKDLYADGKEVWYFLTGDPEEKKPNPELLIQELQKRGKHEEAAV